jgi:AraC-like DNA-binding protein
VPDSVVASPADPLAEALRSVRLTCAVFLDARLTAPFALKAAITPDNCKMLVVRPVQIVAYHVVVEGEVLIEVAGEPPLRLGAGEVVLLPRNDIHLVASPGRRAPVVEGLAFPMPGGEPGLMRIEHGGGGALAQLLCGFMGTDGGVNPLIGALPRVLKVALANTAEREWVEATVRLTARELAAGRRPAGGMSARLAEVLLVEAVRAYAAAPGAGQAGWLRGFADPQVGRALALIHSDIGRDRSVEDLADAAALSRSAFVARFTSLIGEPPMRYVAGWRLAAAKLRLRETRDGIAKIAHEVGYGSAEAFSRAFRRATGQPPAEWRSSGRH